MPGRLMMENHGAEGAETLPNGLKKSASVAAEERAGFGLAASGDGRSCTYSFLSPAQA